MRRNRLLGALVAGLLTAAAVATFALAHGGDTALIHTCVGETNGAMRVVAATETCRSSEYALDWNQQGEPGAPGTPGAAGPAGEKGADGAPPARMGGYPSSAAAGAAAATVGGLVEPLDRRLLRYDYSDVALLGKAVTRGPRWRAAGFAVHAANGAAFGLAFEWARRCTNVAPRRLALGLALAEHVALYPLSHLVDTRHPARGEAGVPPLLRSPRAFAQATWRHALFGLVLGRLVSPRAAATAAQKRS